MAIIGKLMRTPITKPSPIAVGRPVPPPAVRPDPVFSRPSLDFLTGGQPKQTLPADALDRDALIQDILSKIEAPSAPVFDPTGLQARLAELEGRETPVFDPSALEKQIAELQSREAPVFDPSALQQQISDLRQRPGRDDFMSIERQLQDLQNREIPQFDPSNLQEQIGGLQQQIGNIPQFDPSQLQAGISSLGDRLANIPQFDPSNLQSQIGGLQDRLANIPQFDPSNLQEQIGGLQQQIGNIPQFDDSALRDRLQALEGREIPQFDPSNLQSQIGGLEERLANIPAFDPSGLQNRLKTLESREIPQFDPTQLQQGIAGLEDRLANIPRFDPSNLQSQIGGLQDRLANIPKFDDTTLKDRLQALESRKAFDPSVVQSRLDKLEGRKAFDPSVVQSRLDKLEGREIPQFDPSQLQAGIQGLSERISNLPQFDPSALQNRLAELEGRQAPTFNPEDFREQFLNIAREGIDIPPPAAPDLSGFARLEDLPTFDRDAIIRDIRSGIDIPQAPTIDREALIKDITGRIQVPKPPSIDRESIIRDIQDRIKLPTPGRPFDPSRLQERLSNLESRETPRFDPTRLRERLAALENREPAPVAPAFDPSGLQARLRALESRKPVAPPPAFDPSGLQNRLQALESREMPQFNPSRLQERLSALENVQPVTAPPAFDPSRLQARLDALENREPVAAPPAFDPSTLQERLAALENRQPVAPPAFDTSAIDQRFEDIARQLAELQSAQAQPSPDPVVPPVQPLPIQPPSIGRPIPPISIGGPGGGRPMPINVPGGGGIDYGGGEGPPLLPLQPPSDNMVRPLPVGPGIPFTPPNKRPILGPPSPGAGTTFTPGTPLPPPTPEEQARMDAAAASRAELNKLRQQREAGSKSFFEAFPDAPQMPQVGTADVRFYEDPFTGEMKQGSSTQARYMSRLKEYLDANPAAMESYQQNVLAFNPPPSDQGPVFTPIGGPTIKPGVGQPIVPGTSPFTPKGLTGEELLKLPDEELKKYIPTEQLATVGFAPAKFFTPTPEQFRKRLQDDIEFQAGLKPGDRGFGGRRYSLVDDKTRPGGGRPQPPISIGGPGGGRDDIMFPGGSPTFNERGEKFVPPTPVTPTPDPVVEPTPDPVATPTGEPAAPAPAPTIPTPPGSVDPIIMGQTADEVVTDPLIRALYFGTPDQPGFFNQLQQVGANLLGAQAPGTEYDPSMTEKFFNPFEDQVVQQTVEDVLKAGAQRDIAQRAQDVGRGGLSAFGSRARLTADERQEALGRGLGKALAGIRQSGFSEAQRAGLSEFDRQYGRDISQLYRPLDLLRGIGGLLPGYTQATSRIGTTYGMPQDPSALGLGAALSAYSSFAPQTGSAFDNYGQTTGQG